MYIESYTVFVEPSLTAERNASYSSKYRFSCSSKGWETTKPTIDLRSDIEDGRLELIMLEFQKV